MALFISATPRRSSDLVKMQMLTVEIASYRVGILNTVMAGLWSEPQTMNDTYFMPIVVRGKGFSKVKMATIVLAEMNDQRRELDYKSW